MPLSGRDPFVGAKVYRTTTLTLTAATWTAVPMDSEAFDPGGMHDTSSNTSRLTIVQPGYYLCASKLSIASPTGLRTWYSGIRKNGDTTLTTQAAFTSGDFSSTTVTADKYPAFGGIFVTVPLYLVAGDYIECVTYATDAAIVGTASGLEVNNFLSAVLVGV